MIEILSSIHWQYPWWLLLALQPLALWFIVRKMRKQSQKIFADRHLLADILVNPNDIHQSFIRKIPSRDLAYWLGMIFLSLSLAGPQQADKSQTDLQQITQDIMVVIDLSRSMLATDIAPNRLHRAMLETYELISLVKNVRIGVIVYAGRPHLFVPLTTDFKALKFYLQDLDSLILPTQGSDPTAALTLAQSEMQETHRVKAQAHQQVRIWLTDGDIDAKYINPLETEIKNTAKNNISTYIMGLATVEGSAIPLADGSWLESNGQGVVSQMNTALLQRLASIGKGTFSPVQDNDSDWEDLYFQGVLKNNPFANKEITPANQHVKTLYGWFLFPAIVCLLLALFPLSLSTFYKLNFSSKNTSASISILLAMSLISLSTLSKPVYATEQDEYTTMLLEGINTYKVSNFSQSKAHFIQAILDANTDNQRAIALHNLGNVLFQIGDYQQANNIFTDALRYNPSQQQTLNNQQLTQVLAEIINIHLAKQKTDTQLLNNPPESNNTLLDLPDNLPFMLNSKTENKFNLPDIPKLPKQEWTALLNKGLEHLKLIGNSADSRNNKELTNLQNIEFARIHLLNLQQQSSNNLWKRLFEIEEGFPSKLKHPKKLPGVNPW